MRLHNKLPHNWESIEVGNWYSEYQCKNCKMKYVLHDDHDDKLPEDGCDAQLKNAMTQ